MKTRTLSFWSAGLMACAIATSGTSAALAQDDAGPAPAEAGFPEVIGEVPEPPASPAADGMLRLNFQGVPLDTVLDYMSRAAGFVIVRSVTVGGRVDVVSHEPLTPEEAVTLLDTILAEKGYAAIRNGRILTIVSRDDARTRAIPVVRGNDPQTIPNSEQMVTQVIPVRHARAKELIADLQGLLPSQARISANESSNAIVITDTQSSIRRVAQIVQALDQSISEISALRVFPLRYADAKNTADLINRIFAQSPTAGQSGAPNTRQFFSQFRGGGGGGRGGDNQENANPESVALQASSRVLAAADERTNSVVVSAPDNAMATIADLVASVDRSTDILTEVRVFTLRNSSATEMATIVTGIFSEQAQTGRNQQGGRQRFFGPGGFGGGGNNQQANQQSERQQTENRVVAVADARTNSIVVSAVSEIMEQVARVVTELDQNPAKAKRVYTYSLNNARPEDVAAMLDEMFGGSTTTTGGNRNATGNRTNTNNQNRNTNNQNRNTNTGNNQNRNTTR